MKLQSAAFFIFILNSILVMGQTEGSSVSEVLKNINRYYVDSVNQKKITEAAIVAMLEKLDPHSSYIPIEELMEAQTSINGSFFGVGIRFQIIKDTLNVVATIPGGPCEKLGVLPGDKILEVEGKNIAGIGLKNDEVRSKLMGELGTKVTISILRRGQKELLIFTVTRDKIPVHSVDTYYMLDKEIGYIKLNAFSKTTVQEVQDALVKLKAKGMKSLIFDLQGNGGGLLDAAHRLADEFLSGDKLIVYSKGRAYPREDRKAYKSGLFEKGRLVILTDEYAASASEILSGAIQDWDRGLVVGRRTFGKGLVQRPMGLSDGSEIRLTVARYYTPSGRFIQKPYDNPQVYKKDITQRFLNGELTNADSVKLPDSLKFYTLIKNRLVYAGGGIMPDVFVPLDTSALTKYYSSLLQSGLINTFCYQYVNENRIPMKSNFSTFSIFKQKFKCDENFMNLFFDFVNKEKPDLKFNGEEYKVSEKLIKIRLKSLVAQDLFSLNEMYEIFNEDNEILQKAFIILNSHDYDKYGLSQ
ncbi:MAG: S41 family peptidase [Bacteroidetes bacterium]|nr:S41 family peptidase [Bacteroidota bacterium]